MSFSPCSVKAPRFAMGPSHAQPGWSFASRFVDRSFESGRGSREAAARPGADQGVSKNEIKSAVLATKISRFRVGQGSHHLGILINVGKLELPSGMRMAGCMCMVMPDARKNNSQRHVVPALLQLTRKTHMFSSDPAVLRQQAISHRHNLESRYESFGSSNSFLFLNPERASEPPHYANSHQL